MSEFKDPKVSCSLGEIEITQEREIAQDYDSFSFSVETVEQRISLDLEQARALRDRLIELFPL